MSCAFLLCNHFKRDRKTKRLDRVFLRCCAVDARQIRDFEEGRIIRYLLIEDVQRMQGVDFCQRRKFVIWGGIVAQIFLLIQCLDAFNTRKINGRDGKACKALQFEYGLNILYSVSDLKLF